MPRLSVAPIFLTGKQRADLELLARAHSTPQQLAQRARMILHLSTGTAVRETARRVGVWPKTVRGWRRRWLAAGVGEAIGRRLADLERSGAPGTFTPEQVCAIMALACEPPEGSGLPITHWSQSELAREAQRRGIVEKISARSIGRFLKRGGPQASPSAGLAQRQA